MKNTTVITVIIVLFVGIAAFFGGMKYDQSQVSASSGNGQLPQGGARNGGRRGFGGGTIGKIVSADTNSITVQLQDGSSKIVNVLSSTTISKMTTASQSDLTTGQTVAAFGTTNSDGSITATRIQINPMNRGAQDRANGTPVTPGQ